MSLHMLPPLPSSLLLLLKSPFCRTATSSVSTRCSSRRRCTAQAALHLERRVHANYDGGGGRTRLAYASSSSSSSSSPSSSSLPSWNAVPSTSRSISTSLPSRKSTEDPTSPNSLTTPAQDPNEPRLRAHHELYQISSKKRRLVLYNDKTAKKLVDAMDLGKKKDLVVLDLYAGFGALSKHVLNLPNVRQVIAIEDAQACSQQLHELLETSAGRFTQISLDPFWWDTYRVIGEKGLLKSVKKKDWDEEETNLALIGMIPPNINGERLVMQQITCMASQMWLYGNGRFSSYFLLPKTFADRIMAPPGSKQRRKLAVIFQSLVKFEEFLPFKELIPSSENFKSLRIRNTKIEYKAIKIIPKTKTKAKEENILSLDDLDVLEFLTKSLFIHYGSNWVDILKYLAPGAEILKDMLKEKNIHIDPKKKARDLTGEDWLALVKVFQEWPFKPENLEQDDLKMAELADEAGKL